MNWIYSRIKEHKYNTNYYKQKYICLLYKNKVYQTDSVIKMIYLTGPQNKCMCVYLTDILTILQQLGAVYYYYDTTIDTCSRVTGNMGIYTGNNKHLNHTSYTHIQGKNS